MTNPVRGEAELVLPGRTFTLVLDMEALIVAEATYGKPMPIMMADAKAGFVGATRAVFLGSLATFHPDVTKGEALTMIQEHSAEVGAALTKAGSTAWPDPKKKVPGAQAGEDGDDANPPGKNFGGGGSGPASKRKTSSAKRPALTS